MGCQGVDEEGVKSCTTKLQGMNIQDGGQLPAPCVQQQSLGFLGVLRYLRIIRELSVPR